MKKKLVMVLLISLCSISAFSQVSFGANLEAGFPFYSGDDFNGDTKLSYTAGAAFVAEFPINPMFSVIGDIGYTYSMIGYEESSYLFMNKWHKISLDALFKAKFTDNDVKPFVQIGPRASFLLKGTSESSFANVDIDVDNPLVLGYSIGAGVEAPSRGSGKIIAYGINYKGDFTRFMDDLNLYSNSLTLSATMYF